MTTSGDRARIREYGVISLLNFLRLRLLGRDANTPFAGKPDDNIFISLSPL